MGNTGEIAADDIDSRDPALWAAIGDEINNRSSDGSEHRERAAVIHLQLLQSQIAQLTSRMERLQDICRRAWPAIKHWGLCGADSQYTEAMAEMAVELGYSSPLDCNPIELLNRGRAEGMRNLLQLLKESDALVKYTGRSGKDAFLVELERLLRSNG